SRLAEAGTEGLARESGRRRFSLLQESGPVESRHVALRHRCPAIGQASENVTNAFASRLLQDAMEMHRRGAVAEAAARYSQGLSFDPKNVDPLCLLGLAASQEKRFPQSAEVLRKAVKVAPRHAAAHNLLGAALKELGRAEEALKSFDRAISHQPDVMEPYGNRADLLMALNRPGEAVATYDRALARRPNF